MSNDEPNTSNTTFNNPYWPSINAVVDVIKNDGAEIIPFIGAGVTSMVCENLMTSKLVEQLQKTNLVADWVRLDLDKVTQYVNTTVMNNLYCQKLIADYIKREESTFCSEIQPNINDPLWVLANLPFPIYITTNYDTSLECYLHKVKAGNGVYKNPKIMTSNWRLWFDNDQKSAEKKIQFLTKKANNGADNWQRQLNEAKQHQELINWVGDDMVTEQNPVVFHLHGVRTCPESMVLSQDDYIEFLTALSSPKTNKKCSVDTFSFLPRRVTTAFKENHILFLGYSLEDINLHVLMKALRIPNNQMRDDRSCRLRSVQVHPNEAKVCRWVLEDKIECELVEGIKEIDKFKDKFFDLLDRFPTNLNRDDVWNELQRHLELESLDPTSIPRRIMQIEDYIRKSLDEPNNPKTEVIWMDVTQFLRSVYELYIS